VEISGERFGGASGEDASQPFPERKRRRKTKRRSRQNRLAVGRNARLN